MMSTQIVDELHQETGQHPDNKVIASSPSSTTSGCHSADDSYNEDKQIIPSTLIEDELKLALNKVFP